MDAIDTAIRSAFAKGDPLDPAFRERVYRSAAAAMERTIEANRTLSAEEAEARREGVNVTISRIESEFTPALATGTEAPGQFGQQEEEREVATPPMVEAEPRTPAATPYVEPRLDAPGPRRRAEDHGLGGVEPNRRRGDRRVSKGFSRVLPAAVVVVAVAAAIWWAASSGFLRAPETAEAPAEAVTDQTATGGSLLPQPASTQDWITVFSPGDPTRVSAPANASAEVSEDDSGRFMRIRSGAEGTPVSFGIGQGILERIAGRRAVFNIVARAEEGMPTEIAVECDFGALGDCGRKRYPVNYERGDFLFDVQLREGAPAEGGTISITSDVENAGKAVDIYEIRVSVSE